MINKILGIISGILTTIYIIVYVCILVIMPDIPAKRVLFSVLLGILGGVILFVTNYPLIFHKNPDMFWGVRLELLLAGGALYLLSAVLLTNKVV